MHTLSVKRDFIARHFLVGGDWGAENELHAHHYVVELQLSGESLDEHGYLVDIVAVEALLDGLVARYRDRTLNELPAFTGLNPSIEHFSRILAQSLNKSIQAHNITALAVVVWENDIAWASYRLERRAG
jgi:6-pyruvoyltetrahydropterin/6-carboxytetrahydropterin synthase